MLETAMAHPQADVEERITAGHTLGGGLLTSDQNNPTRRTIMHGATETAVNQTAVQPLTGGVNQTADKPLTGSVDQSLHALLTGGIDQTARSPLTGGIDRTAVVAPPTFGSQTGQFDKNNPSLQGRVQDQQNNLLQGQVNRDRAPELRGMTPTGAATMRITQFRTLSDPTNFPPRPSSLSLAIPARGIAGGDMTAPPKRSIPLNTQRPQRTANDTGGPPQRDVQNRPSRSEEGPPQRPEYDETAPTRIAHSIELAPQRPLRARTPSIYPGWEPDEPPTGPPVRVDWIETIPGSRHLRNGHDGNGINVDQIQEEKKRMRKEKRDRRSESDKVIAPSSVDAQVKLQPTQVPAGLSAQPLDPIQETLLWDRWYAHINDLVCRGLNTTLGAHGDPAGKCLIHIVITPNHRLQATVVRSSDPAFGQAILEAYKILDGNAELAFPQGTRRSKQEYETEHEKDLPQPISQINSDTIHGDREYIK